jgi:hypothetical protein
MIRFNAMAYTRLFNDVPFRHFGVKFASLTFKFIGCRKCEEAMAQNETPNFLFKMF